MARGYHHGDLRRALLDAALALFSERGGLDFTLRELARRAGVTHNAPYRHFAGKDALRSALAAEGYGLLGAALGRRERGVPDLRRRIRVLGEAYVRFAVEHPHHFRLMVMTPLGPLAGAELRAAASASFDVLRRAIASAQGAGVVRDDLDDAELGLAAWALVHGLGSLLVGGQLPASPGAIARHAALLERVFFEGARPAGAARGKRRAAPSLA